MRRPIVLATALVAGLGAALVLAVPVNAAGIFTSQIDTAGTLYPGGPLTWSGQHDADGTLTWNAIADGGDPEGIDLAPDCAPTSGTDPVSYSCTLDPIALAPGGYTLVGQLTGPSSQIANYPQPHFTVAEPATLSTDASIRAGDVLHFGGTRIATGGMSNFRVDGDLIAQDSCVGAFDASTSWSCMWTSPVTLGLGSHALTVTFTDSRSEESTDLATTFDVDAAPPPATTPPTIALSFAPASITATVTPTDGATVADIRIARRNGSTFGTVADCAAATVCTASGLAPGLYAVEATTQGTHSAGVYAVVHDAPVITSADITQSEGVNTVVSGTGEPGDTILLGDGESTYCDGYYSTPTVDDDGQWICDTGEVGGPLTAVQTDVGAGEQDGQISDDGLVLGYRSGAQSPPSAPVAPTADIPAVSYRHAPGSITVTATPTHDQPLDAVGVVLYSWDATNDFSAQARCGNALSTEAAPEIPVDVAQSDDGVALTCVFSGLTPGIWNPYSDQGTGAWADDYFVIPVAPTIDSVTDRGSGAASIAGAGTDGDLITVTDGGTAACTATVAAGRWSCEARPGVGSHTFRASQVDQGAGRDDAILETDSRIVYRTGGTSALSTARAVILAAPATTPGTTLTTPVWTFSIDGIDTSNLHPGDTFTASGSGLPAGSTVTFVLHSTPVTLGRALVDRTGAFAFQGTIPLDTTPGAHQIIATLSGTGLTSTTNAKDVTVVGAVPASDEQQESSEQSEQTGSGAGSGSGDKRDVGIEPDVAPNVLTNGLYSIGDVVNHPEKVPAAIAIGLVLLVLGILPAHLLDATLSEQWEHLGRRNPRLGRNPGWLARLHALLARAPAIGGLAVTAATAVLFCFADPRFGFNPESLRLVIALAVALFIVTYVVDWFTKLIVRGAWGAEVTIRLRPLGLVLALLGVIASRMLHFSPGFLIGLVLGLSIAGHAVGRYAWRAVLVRSGLIIGLAIAAWLGFSAFSGESAEHDFTSALLLELLVAIATEGIVALLVELLPFHLLEGEHVFRRSKVLWGLAYLVALVVFIVAVVPWEGNWATLGSGLWGWLAVLAGFALIALTVYVVFRVRSRRHHEVEADEEADAVVSLNED
ncbi:hypothetical protein GCM10009840_30780 [Pseudolysinimonas kribbensis]|uniref:Ig-like domain repeat protein n=1 Tax=Pseudolysinimonas kribbensis TaxID=433641 RepID=A0ABQ6KC19_9MICO|nr:hypothetical protein [Pseudolysinimonas kribbensis]GMA96066.1 hypothetical protein GCM10025881_28900 [Pseudolysinimonas kribbensis]